MPRVTTAFYSDFRQDVETKPSFVLDKKRNRTTTLCNV